MNNDELRRFEQSQIIKLKKEGCIVIRLDGKDVTKNKQEYDLTGLKEFHKSLLDEAEKILVNYLEDT